MGKQINLDEIIENPEKLVKEKNWPKSIADIFTAAIRIKAFRIGIEFNEKSISIKSNYEINNIDERYDVSERVNSLIKYLTEAHKLVTNSGIKYLKLNLEDKKIIYSIEVGRNHIEIQVSKTDKQGIYNLFKLLDTFSYIVNNTGELRRIARKDLSEECETVYTTIPHKKIGGVIDMDDGLKLLVGVNGIIVPNLETY